MNTLAIYQKMSSFPGGARLFSWIAAKKAPYFSSISPLITELHKTGCQVFLKKRRKVLNHLGTVHAIALCNACELAFGLTMEAGISSDLRWIPKGMTVRYLKPAKTNLIAKCSFPQLSQISPGDHVVRVNIEDLNNIIVMEADITVYVSKKT